MYTLKELEKLPTLSAGQGEDLKIERGNTRVWLSQNKKVTVEQYLNGRWLTVREYKAL